MSEIRVPDLGENIDEASVLRVLVSEGQRVEADQPILELESDKASFELPSPEAGVVRRILVHEGDTVKVGQAAIELDRPPRPATPDQAARAQQAASRSAEAAAAQQAGPPARPPEPPAPEQAAPLRAAPASSHEPAPPPQGGAAPERPAEHELARQPTRRDQEAYVPEVLAAGPATRRFARELGIDLADVAHHTGAERITREHIMAYVRGQEESWRTERADQRERLEHVHRLGAERLAAAWREVPLVTHHELADITELESARRALRDSEPDVKLTITALAVKAVAVALRRHPRLNSSLDLERGELILHHALHVGIAVDTEHGLLAPVLRDARHKTTRELAAEVAELARRARDRTLSPRELAGATFSITNLGGISGTAFTPIVVPPQVAILGLGRARSASVLQRRAPIDRIWLPLSLSYDHRAIDGAEAARFIADLVRLLQSPLHLVLDC